MRGADLPPELLQRWLADAGALFGEIKVRAKMIFRGCMCAHRACQGKSLAEGRMKPTDGCSWHAVGVCSKTIGRPGMVSHPGRGVNPTVLSAKQGYKHICCAQRTADAVGAMTIYHTTAFPWHNATLASMGSGTETEGATTAPAASYNRVSVGSPAHS